MKVLHLIDSGGLYGAEQVVLSLAEAQIKVGHDVVVGSIAEAIAPPKAIEVAARTRGIPVVRLEVTSGVRPVAITQLVHAIRPLRPDVIHSHGYKGNVLLASLARRQRPAPMVATIHGWTSASRLSKNALYEWLDRRALHRFDAVVAVGRKMMSSKAMKSLKHVTVVPNGIPVGAPALLTSDPLIARLQEFCQREPTITMVGRLSHEKNQALAIKAISSLRNSGLAVQLLLAGEGRLRGELESLVNRLDLSHHVEMPGYVDSGFRLFPYSCAMLLTSSTEGLPICVLEAMRAQLPVISTAVGDIPEVLSHGKGGWLVPTEDQRALETAIRECVASATERQSRGAISHARFVAEFTTGRMAQQYDEVYSAVMASANRE